MMDIVERTRIGDLREARERTRALAADLRDEQFTVPMLEGINPILWELGHIAYFAEFWIARHLGGRAPLVAGADALYDSAKVAHETRWSLPLPSREQTSAFMDRELALIADLWDSIRGERAEYFYRLALFHEDMHGEALVYTRQTLAYAQPSVTCRPIPAANPLTGDARIRGGRYTIGARPGDGFVFDNEKWAHEIELDAFEIARAPVTNAEFAAFVEDGGYSQRGYWSDSGWAWREAARAAHPVYWIPRAGGRGAGAFDRRHFDRIRALREHEPVCHVNFFEAEAYCAWAGRRLPTEAEWEVAATGGMHRRYPWGEDSAGVTRANLDHWFGDVCDVGAFEDGESPTGCRQMLGNVWEWTGSIFAAYPGFVTDPYREYSEPWFGTHRVLRGGAWSTRERLISTRWRNFYQPHRRDIITGFRTVKQT